jgi:DNA-binding NtrC family response regulator
MSTILCIDHEPVAGAVLERQLAGLGHQPLVVTSVEEGLRVLARQSVDLVISDYPMPNDTGLDLLAMLREQGPEVPVIVMAAYSSIEHAVAGIRHGAFDYLSKPLRAETLRLAVTHGIEVSRLRRENENFRREIDALRGRRRPHAPNREIGRMAEPHPVRTNGGPESGSDAPINLRELERLAIDRALAVTGGHRMRAAELLGISERTLRNRLNGPSATDR